MPQRAVVGLHFEIRRVHRIRPSWRRIISLRRHYQRRGAQSPPSAKPAWITFIIRLPLSPWPPCQGWSSLRRPRPHAAQAAPPTSRKATYRSRTATAGLGRKQSESARADPRTECVCRSGQWISAEPIEDEATKRTTASATALASRTSSGRRSGSGAPWAATRAAGQRVSVAT